MAIKFRRPPNSLFNACSDHFSYPINYKDKFLTHTVKNPTTISGINGGFGQGWNYFQFELAYDPNYLSDLTLSINSYNIQVSKLEINGNYNSLSEGTIISSSTKNIASGAIKGIATGVGKEGSKWISEKFTDSSKLADIATAGTSEIIKTGVNLVLGSFLGFLKKPQETKHQLQFTTNGTIQLTGELINDGIGLLRPLNYIPTFTDSTFNERLGLWNLADDPVIYLKRYLYHNHNGGNPMPPIAGEIPPMTQNDFLMDAVYNIGKPALIINPAIQPYIKKQTCDIQLIRYVLFDGKQTQFCANNYIGNFTPNAQQLSSLYDDGKNKFTKKNTIIKYFCLGCNNDRIDLKSRNAGLYPDHVVKVTVKFEMEYQGKEHTFYSTRTYKPKYEWYENKF